MRTCPCLDAGAHLSPGGTTLSGAILGSIQSSLLWSLSDCIVIFRGFSAKIQKHFKLNGTKPSSSFSLLPKEKWNKTKNRNSLHVFVFSVKQWYHYSPSLSICHLLSCFPCGPRCCSFCPSYEAQSLPCQFPLLSWVLARVSLLLGNPSGTPHQSSFTSCMIL